MNSTRELLDAMPAPQQMQAACQQRHTRTQGDIAWRVDEARGTVTLKLRHDNGSTAELTLMPDEAMRLADTMIQVADTIQRRRAA